MDQNLIGIPSPVESNHFVIVVRINKHIVDISLAAATGNDRSTAVAIRRKIPVNPSSKS